MYKALAFKELRENALIGGLMCGALLLLVVLGSMGFSPAQLLAFGQSYFESSYGSKPIPFVDQSLHEWVAIISTVGALAMGFHQVLGESFRGTWLYLLHRPAPRDAVMLTKLATGMALLLAAAIIPLLVLAVWAAVPGTHASPFDWRMTEHPLRLTFAATMPFLAAWLTGLRAGRWYGSRLLPLFPALILLFIMHANPLLMLSTWITIALTDLVYLAAIRHVARLREYP